MPEASRVERSADIELVTAREPNLKTTYANVPQQPIRQGVRRGIGTRTPLQLRQEGP